MARQLRPRRVRPGSPAPAVTRALVAVSADVLPISESHPSLEDIYLELIDQDKEPGRL
jgi:ABC-2 type transport system ATP-binding protein